MTVLQNLETYLAYLEQDSQCNPRVLEHVRARIRALQDPPYELAQEQMYLIWRSGRLANQDTLLAQMWSMDYFAWLMQTSPAIYSAEK